MKHRAELADKLEVLGEMFENDGMAALMNKFEAGMSTIRFNAVVIQIEGLLMKTNPGLAGRLICMSSGKTQDDVDKMTDQEFALGLRDAIITDVMGFFASSPHTDGRK